VIDVRGSYVNVRLNINGEELLVPVVGESSVAVENREPRPAKLRLELVGAEWSPAPLVLKVEANGKVVYIGRSTRSGESWSFQVPPKGKVTLRFTVVAPPRLAMASASSVSLRVSFEQAAPIEQAAPRPLIRG